MSASGVSVRLKRLRQRFGISAPKLAIKTHVAWYWRALALMAILSLSFAISMWIYDAGRRIARIQGDDSVSEIQSLRDRVLELDSELAKLRSLADSGENNLQIERVTQKQLSLQVKALEIENAVLKEDLAFFEGLMPDANSGNEAGVRIGYLRIEPDGAIGQYRYRMLVVNKASIQVKEFKGSLQLLVKVRRGSKDDMIRFPSGEEPNPQRFSLEVKTFRRLEGVFTVPSEVVVTDVEARLLQDGVVRARQSVTL